MKLEDRGSKKIIVDVSINFHEGKMCGDVYKDNEFLESLQNIYVTPVPNGVGQCTVLALIENVVEIAKKYN